MKFFEKVKSCLEKYKVVWKSTKKFFGKEQRSSLEKYKEVLWKSTKKFFGKVQRISLEKYKEVLWESTKNFFSKVQSSLEKYNEVI